MNTKKILLLYGGSAIALGAISFFVWSFFQKPDISLSKNDLGTSDEKQNNTENNSSSNYFKSLMDITFDPISLKPYK
jgi:hypothetical protein